MKSPDQAKAELLTRCHRLLNQMAARPYGASLLAKTARFLEASLSYKAGRSIRPTTPTLGKVKV